MNVLTEGKGKSFILSFKDKYPNKYLRVQFPLALHKDISYLKDFCKENNISCISKIDNTIGESVLEEKNLKFYGIQQIIELKVSYEELQKAQQNPRKILINLLMSYLWQ